MQMERAAARGLGGYKAKSFKFEPQTDRLTEWFIYCILQLKVPEYVDMIKIIKIVRKTRVKKKYPLKSKEIFIFCDYHVLVIKIFLRFSSSIDFHLFVNIIL